MTLRLVNLTPHRLNLIVDDVIVAEQSPDGPPARVEEVRSRPQEIAAEFGSFPLVEVSYSEKILSLPARQDGVLLVVSRPTASAATHRDDVVFPLDEVRDEKGDVIGCRALGRFRRTACAVREES